MLKKKLSKEGIQAKQEKKILEHNADVILKEAVRRSPYIIKLEIINRLMTEAKLKRYLALQQRNIKDFERENINVEYYSKCFDYELKKTSAEMQKKGEELLKVITNESPIITVGDFLKSGEFKENVKKQAEAILRVPEQIIVHDTARKRFKIEIEVDPADNERVQALKNDGFRRHHRSDERFIDVYFKYI